MTLAEFIESVTGDRTTLTLYNVSASPAVTETLASYVEPQRLELREGRTESGQPADFAVLHSDDEFIAASPLSRIHEYVDLDTGMISRDMDAVTIPEVLKHVDNATFSEYGKRRMILASREIEQAAWQCDAGELHSGFQRLSLVDTQRRVYNTLGDSGVETHVYGLPDDDTDFAAELGINAHGVEADEIAESWFVIYDGAGSDEEKCALVARETSTNTYTGFWTYRADLVDRIYDYVTGTYP